MSNARLRIEGILEVEGPLEFVEQIYREFKEGALSKSKTKAPHIDSTSRKKQSKAGAASRRKPNQDNQPQMLDGVVDVEKLKEFYALFNVSSGRKATLLFAYFLSEIQKVEGITGDHIYTCFRLVKHKVPKAFQQTIIDCRGKMEWIKIDEEKNIDLTDHGRNQVEHEFKRKTDVGN